MPNRSEILGIAVAGLTAGVGAASVNLAARYVSDPGDVLGFAGGALGAGLAVCGALFVEHRKAIVASEAQRMVLFHAIAAVPVAAILTARAHEESLWGNLVAIRQAFDALAVVRRSLPIDDGTLNTRIALLEDWITRWRPELEALIAEVEQRPTDAPLHPEAYTLARSISAISRWVLSQPEKWPTLVRGTIASMNADAETVFPDRIHPTGFGPADPDAYYGLTWPLVALHLHNSRSLSVFRTDLLPKIQRQPVHQAKKPRKPW